MPDTKISALTSATTPLAGTEVLPIVQSSATKKVSVDNLTAGKAVSALSLTATNGIINAIGTAGLQASGGASNSNPNPGAQTNYAGTVVTWAVNNTAFSGTLWSAQAVQGTGYYLDTSDLVFYYRGTSERARYTEAGDYKLTGGNVVIATSGKGIDFSANTHAAGMTSELLTWYEEGTFTPTVAFGGASTGITYGTPRIGRYTRIGRMVYIQLYIVLTSKGSSTGSATITGLPFTSDSTTGVRGGASFSINYNVTFADQVYGVILNNTSAISLYQTTNAGALSTITNTNFANDSEFSMIASYQV